LILLAFFLWQSTLSGFRFRTASIGTTAAMPKITKPEAEKAIRYLSTKWAGETGFDYRSGEMPSFSAFASWLRANKYDGYLNFRSTGGPLSAAEQWFDEELHQTWRN
jgi:hypothetical protein